MPWLSPKITRLTSNLKNHSIGPEKAKLPKFSLNIPKCLKQHTIWYKSKKESAIKKQLKKLSGLWRRPFPPVLTLYSWIQLIWYDPIYWNTDLCLVLTTVIITRLHEWQHRFLHFWNKNAIKNQKTDWTKSNATIAFRRKTIVLWK